VSLNIFLTLFDMANPIKVLLLTHNYPRYAGDYSGVFLTLLTRRLPQYGITPIVVAPHDKGIPEAERLDGVQVERFRYAADESHETLAYRGNMDQQVRKLPLGPLRLARFNRAFRKAAQKVLERESIDVIAGHWLVPAGLIMRSLRRRSSIPMVLSSHGTDIRLIAKYRTVLHPYMRGFFQTLYRWTVVSSFLRDQLKTVDNEIGSHCEVLPLPHDESIFFRDSAIERQSSLVVSTTRFTRQKRVDILIKAFAQVRQASSSARLVIIGTGPLQSDMENLIAAEGLQSAVEILPPQPQDKLREYYNRATVVVLNSVDEGFGLTLSEAMLCGAATVGTDSGGIVDIIRHEQTGLLVAPDSVEDLAAGISRLLGDMTLRSQLADSGLTFAQQTFASEPLATRYADILRSAVEDTSK
jgi:glycosyltransferase involved in cell wall biosynthesis